MDREMENRLMDGVGVQTYGQGDREWAYGQEDGE